MVIPELYAYKKLYAYNYDHVIGYMELKLNPQILSEYFSQFRDNTSFHGGLSALYHNREILYTTDNIDDFSFLETIPELPSNTSLSDVLHNRSLKRWAITENRSKIRICSRNTYARR